MPEAYNPTTTVGMVRLLANDTNAADYLFTDAEIGTFLALEGDSVKLAAAQAIDTIADNEALLAKAIRTQDLQTDGPKVADSLRKRAIELRSQAYDQDADGGYFEAIDINTCGAPELSVWP